MSAKRRSSGSDAVRLAGRVREAIDRGADTAESIHKKAAALPLAPFEGVEALDGAVKEVRRLLNRSIGAVYDFVRSVNHEVGRLVERFLTEATPRPQPRRRAVRRPVRAVPAHEAA